MNDKRIPILGSDSVCRGPILFGLLVFFAGISIFSQLDVAAAAQPKYLKRYAGDRCAVSAPTKNREFVCIGKLKRGKDRIGPFSTLCSNQSRRYWVSCSRTKTKVKMRTAGVSSTISATIGAEVGFISKISAELSASLTGSLEWSKTFEVSVEVGAKVPPRRCLQLAPQVGSLILPTAVYKTRGAPIRRGKYTYYRVVRRIQGSIWYAPRGSSEATSTRFVKLGRCAYTRSWDFPGTTPFLGAT